MLDRLLARFGYYPREFARINNGADAIARGQRWEAFYSEEGGLGDMIAALRFDFFQGYTRLAADDYEGRDRAAQFDIVLKSLDSKVKSIITTGKMATDAKAKAERFTAIRR